jgi:YegS/Rv2252/BmrU family lipid kinase
MMIIANPRAGHGAGTGNLERLRALIRRHGLDCTAVPTERPGHATELARTFAQANGSRLAVMGGDGTISEVVQALAGSEVELAVLSVGTGNDVARSLGLPMNDLEAALEIAIEGRPRPVDVGRERDRDFISVLGVVFPALVAYEANRMTFPRGSAAFFVAVYKALHRLRAVPLSIELDDVVLERECVAVMVQNTPYTGGGLHMAPTARVDDGLFDVVVVERIGKLDLMINFPKVYRGRHFEHPSFSLHRTRSVTIRSEEPLEKMFDGDLCGWTPVEATVIPGGLQVVLPA